MTLTDHLRPWLKERYFVRGAASVLGLALALGLAAPAAANEAGTAAPPPSMSAAAAAQPVSNGQNSAKAESAEPLLQALPYPSGFIPAKIRWIHLPSVRRLWRYGTRIACFGIVVDAKGKVSNVRLLTSSGSSKVDSLMTSSVRRALTYPATLNGKPVAVKFVFIERWEGGAKAGPYEPQPPCSPDGLKDFPVAPSSTTPASSTAPPPHG